MSKKKTEKSKSTISEKPKVIKQKAEKPKPPVMNIEFFVQGIVNRKNYPLVAGFMHQEKVNKRVRDTKENYAARFEEFKAK